METNHELATQTATTIQPSIFTDAGLFEQAQRFANALCKSNIVPTAYQNNLPNTLVALEMANRMGESPLMVMQNLDIVHGRPSFNSKFIIARLNTSGKFSPLRFEYAGDGDKRTCIAVATDLRNNQELRGSVVSIEMAKKEGWYSKSGSKWPNMPDLMLMYRSATFFGRMYAPELTMGMQSTDEVTDIITVDAVATEVKSEPANINDKLNLKPKAERKPTVKTPPAEQTGAAPPDPNDELM
jgi:hypothetical protein